MNISFVNKINKNLYEIIIDFGNSEIEGTSQDILDIKNSIIDGIMSYIINNDVKSNIEDYFNFSLTGNTFREDIEDIVLNNLDTDIDESLVPDIIIRI